MALAGAYLLFPARVSVSLALAGGLSGEPHAGLRALSVGAAAALLAWTALRFPLWSKVLAAWAAAAWGLHGLAVLGLMAFGRLPPEPALLATGAAGLLEAVALTLMHRADPRWPTLLTDVLARLRRR